MTRAQIVALARNGRLGMTAKFVGTLFWPTTGTWAKGEGKSVPLAQVAVQIVTPSSGGSASISAKTIQRVVQELEDAGYVTVDRTPAPDGDMPPTSRPFGGLLIL